MTIEVLTPPEEGSRKRIKRIRVDVNGKRAEYPRKLAQISASSAGEGGMVKAELGMDVPTEYYLEISNSTLRSIVADGKEHQRQKNRIQRRIAQSGGSLNMVYIRLKDEWDGSGQVAPFPRPTEAVLNKIFDLADVDGVDLVCLPVHESSPLDWAKRSLEVFSKRGADFMEEFKLVGHVPWSISSSARKAIVRMYAEAGLDCLSFDFGGRTVSTSETREIIENVIGEERWGGMYVHGANVPYYDYNTYANHVSGSYDLLMGLYGFDSFTNQRFATGGGASGEKALVSRIKNRRYAVIDDYGMYRMEGLERMMETGNHSCPCPACRRSRPLDLYYDALGNSGSKALKEALDYVDGEMKTHRHYSAHVECSNLQRVVGKGTYSEHLSEKKRAKREIDSILND